MRPLARFVLCTLLGGLILGCGAAATPTDAAIDAASDTAKPDTAVEDTAPPVVLPDTPLTLSVVTYNVGRFFDTTCDTGRCGNFDFEMYPTPSQYQARLDEVGKAIVALDADIVLLQEIENTSCFNDLLAKVGSKYAVQILGETGAPGSLDVAVLARGVHLETVTHRDYSFQGPNGDWTTFSREFLEVHVEIAGWRIVLFNAHFKSKTGDDPERRLAEATKAQELVVATVAKYPHALVVMGGDLNDVPGSKPLEAIALDGALMRVASDIPAGEDWTFHHSGNLVALDHLYLARDANGAYVGGSAAVWRDESAFGWGGSDHGALKATFRLDPPTR